MEIIYIPGQPNHIIDFSWKKCKSKHEKRQRRRETDGRMNNLLHQVYKLLQQYIFYKLLLLTGIVAKMLDTQPSSAEIHGHCHGVLPSEDELQGHAYVL